jgi:FkbM family methyltransferase
LPVVEICNGFKLNAEGEIEQFRCDTFFSKEPETVLWIEESLSAQDCFYDIGANIGVYAVYAATLYPKLPVFAFEPFPSNFYHLCQNIFLNNINNITPVNIAIGNESRTDILHIKDARTASSGHQVGGSTDEDGTTFDPVNMLPVLVASLDDTIRFFKLKTPTHIKLDVDGLELDVINGMHQTLANRVLRYVLVEVNHITADADQIIKTIESFGFSRGNKYNEIPNHSSIRRTKEGIGHIENIIFSR